MVIRTRSDITSASLWVVNTGGRRDGRIDLPFKTARRYLISFRLSGLTFPVGPIVSKTSFRRRTRTSGCSASIVTTNVVKPAVCQGPSEYAQALSIH